MLKHNLAPLLRSDGFKGSGKTFRRFENELIHVVNIQGSRYGSMCCVNLAVHLSFLPTAGGGRLIDIEKIKEYEVSQEKTFIFAFEESCGYLSGTHSRDKDAVVAAVLFAEMACYYQEKGKGVE